MISYQYLFELLVAHKSRSKVRACDDFFRARPRLIINILLITF